MITLSQVIENIMSDAPFLEDMVARDIINLSSLSRELKPQVDKVLMKNVKVGTIMVSLKRLQKSMKHYVGKVDLSKMLLDITVKSNLLEVTYKDATNLAEKIRKLYDEAEKNSELFCTHSQGIHETTIIASKSFESRLEEIFKNQKVITKISDLSAIILSFTPDTAITPGAYYALLKKIAWDNINILEFISTNNELTLLFRDEDIEKAFSILKSINKSS